MAEVASIGVESRFAVLQKKKRKPKKEDPAVEGIKKPGVNAKQTQLQNSAPKKKPQTQPPLVGLPGNHIPEDPEEKKKRKKKKKMPNQTAQWDAWRQKDDEVVDKEFDKSLQEALALSKLEAKRRLMVPPVICTKDAEPKPNENNDTSNTSVLTNSTQSKKTLDKNNMSLLNNMIDSQISQEKLKSLFEEKSAEVDSLRQGMEKLQEEMQRIKFRNKTLCTIISEGELKSKADLILELEASGKVKEELVSEVNRLNILLEQERSKVHLLTTGERNNKEKNKKNRMKSECEK